MANVLARQVKVWYPAIPSYNKLKYQPSIRSVLINFDRYLDRNLFNLNTKIRFYDKPTYKSVLASLYELREMVISEGIRHLSLPKLASGYDNLDFNNVFELICHVFDPLPITISIHLQVQTRYRPAIPSTWPKSPTSPSNVALEPKIRKNSNSQSSFLNISQTTDPNLD